MPFGIQEPKTTSLTIRGGPDASGLAPLRIGPQSESAEELDLYLAAPPSAEMPLFIGYDNDVSGVLTTYLDGEAGFGGASFNNNTSLYISPISNSGSPLNTNINLRVLGPPFAELTENIPLYINPSPIPTGSGIVTTYVSGSLASSSDPVLDEGQTTLFIRDGVDVNDNAPLHIETDFNLGDTAPLYIQQRNPTTVAPLFMSGQTVATTTAPLYIAPPTDDNTTLYLIGFSE
jgi:hypothetical protein